jgi:anti-sigma factor RsiW
MSSVCDRVREELLEYVTGDSKEPDRVAAHVRDCPACAEEERRLREDLRLLAADTPEVQATVSSDFRARFWREVERRRSRPIWLNLPTWVRIAAPVATLLLVAIGYVSMRHETRLPPSVPSEVGEPMVVTTPVPAPELPQRPVVSEPATETSAGQEVAQDEVIENLEFIEYLQYQDMLDQSKAERGEVVLPGENGS